MRREEQEAEITKPWSHPCRMLSPLRQPPCIIQGCACASSLLPSLPFSRGDDGPLQPKNCILSSCSEQLQTGR